MSDDRSRLISGLALGLADWDIEGFDNDAWPGLAVHDLTLISRCLAESYMNTLFSNSSRSLSTGCFPTIQVYYAAGSLYLDMEGVGASYRVHLVCHASLLLELRTKNCSHLSSNSHSLLLVAELHISAT